MKNYSGPNDLRERPPHSSFLLEPNGKPRRFISWCVAGCKGFGFAEAPSHFASERGLGGWAKKLPGRNRGNSCRRSPESLLDEFVQWCEQGPPAAEVTGIEVTPVPAREMETFIIR